MEPADDGSVTIYVNDTGIGMSDAEISQALEKFGRVQETRQADEEGSGLGLPLSQALVHAHGET